MDWIKDYCEKDFDCSDLTGFQRWLMDAIRRWRGRAGSNVRADLEAIMSATCAHPKERKSVPQAVLELVVSGRLIPTNQRFSPLDKSKLDKSREENTNRERAVASHLVSEESSAEPIETSGKRKLAQEAAQYFHEKFGEAPAAPNTVRQTTDLFLPYVADTWDQLKLYIDFALQDTFWAEKVTDTTKLVEFLDKEDSALRKRAKAWQRASKITKQKPSAPVSKNRPGEHRFSADVPSELDKFKREPA